MATIELSISSSYAPSWGDWEAVRDLYQNVRDAVVMHGAEQEVIYSASKKELCMISRGVTIDLSKLVMGESEKHGVAEAAGENGEGMKLAWVALLRGGRQVVVRTGNMIWKPKLIRSETFNGVEVLAVQTIRARTQTNGVEVRVTGIEEKDWELYKKRLLGLAPPPKDKTHTVDGAGSVIFDPEYKGKLFVKGIYVQDVPSLTHGYDLQNLKVDRDRRLASHWDISYETTRLLTILSRKSKETAKKLYEGARDGAVDGDGYSLKYAGQDVVDALIAEFEEEYGPDAIAVKDESEAAKLRYVGGKPVIVKQNLREVIELKKGTFHSVYHKLTNSPCKHWKPEDLDVSEHESLEYALVKLLGISIDVTTQIVDFADEKIRAKIDTESGNIWLARKVLQDKHETLGTLVHEVAHRRSCAGDGDVRHTAEIESLWVQLYKQT